MVSGASPAVLSIDESRHAVSLGGSATGSEDTPESHRRARARRLYIASWRRSDRLGEGVCLARGGLPGSGRVAPARGGPIGPLSGSFPNTRADFLAARDLTRLKLPP